MIKYLWFQVNDICNSRCTYCNIWKNKKPNDIEMTPLQLHNILTDKAFRNVEYIINSGGEPTLDPKLRHLLYIEHKALPQATIQLSTNALLPEKVLQAAKYMKRLGSPLQIGISLDGIGEEHDKIRGVKGNFEKITKLIPTLRKFATVTVGATLTEENIDANLHALEWAKENNVPFMFHWLNKSSFYNNLDNQYTNKKILDAVSLLPPSIYRDIWIKNLKGKRVYINCKALTYFCVLKRNGDISPCLSLWNHTIGNALKQSPSIILENADKNKIRKCQGCLNNWGVVWSLGTIDKYLWWAKNKVRGKLK